MNKCEIAENKVTKEVTIKEYYAKILELSALLIEKHGYKRSGKSGIFYKYNSNKSKGSLIGFRKSLDNTPDFYAFHIAFGNVGIDDLCGFGTCRNKVSLQDLKSMLMNGHFTLSCSHKLDDYVVNAENASDYFHFNVLPELKKILNQLSPV